MSKNKEKEYPFVEKVSKFLLLEPMIESLVNEMKELSKKKPDGPLNALKVGMINKRLRPMKEVISILTIAEFLDELDESTLPTNSDTVLILGQYTGALKAFRKAYHGYNLGDHGWWTDNGFKDDNEFK